MSPWQPVSEADEPRFHCTDCHDESSAWRPFWCAGMGELRRLEKPITAAGDLASCGRMRAHIPHGYVEKCACSATNPVIAEHRAREARWRKPRDGR